MNASEIQEKSLRNAIRKMEIGETKRFPIKRTAYVRVAALYLKKFEGQSYTTASDWDNGYIIITRDI